MKIPYKTRDEKGNDFIKMVEIKDFPIVEKEIECPICKKKVNKCNSIKKIVSGKFTDWLNVGDYICLDCSKLFSLHFYNYIVNENEIRLINIREVKDEICRKQNPPFMFVITTSQKKHLFYKSKVNYDSDNFAVNLETETIYTTCERMKLLFDFVECMITLGASKKAMKDGEISFNILQKTGFDALDFLQSELKGSREIQIPLYCGQKLEKTEDEALCTITSILQAKKEQKHL